MTNVGYLAGFISACDKTTYLFLLVQLAMMFVKITLDPRDSWCWAPDIVMKMCTLIFVIDGPNL